MSKKKIILQDCLLTWKRYAGSCNCLSLLHGFALCWDSSNVYIERKAQPHFQNYPFTRKQYLNGGGGPNSATKQKQKSFFRFYVDGNTDTKKAVY